jgi:hypothetical protein
MKDPTIVRTFVDRTEADLARGMLESEGIAATVVSDDCAANDPALSMANLVQLVVDGTDLERASSLLEESIPESEIEAAERETEPR